MSQKRNAIAGVAVADSHNTIRGWVKRDGAYLTQADFDAPGKIEWQAEDPADDSVLVAWIELTVSEVVYNTPQTRDDDADWDGADAYNFKFAATPDAFPNGQKNYRVKVKFTHTDGTIGHLVARGPIAQLT